MKASKFSDAQKAFILKQGVDGVPVADIYRTAGISPATYFNWKKRYDGLLPTEMKRLKQLEYTQSMGTPNCGDGAIGGQLTEESGRAWAYTGRGGATGGPDRTPLWQLCHRAPRAGPCDAASDRRSAQFIP
jgi:hypothetical protein